MTKEKDAVDSEELSGDEDARDEEDNYSTRHRNVPVLESYNGRRTEETLQSVWRFFTTSRRLHYRSKDVPFLRTVAPFSIKR